MKDTSIERVHALQTILYDRLKDRQSRRPKDERMGDDDCLDLTWIAARRLCEFNPEVQDAVELMMDGRMLP